MRKHIFWFLLRYLLRYSVFYYAIGLNRQYKLPKLNTTCPLVHAEPTRDPGNGRSDIGLIPTPMHSVGSQKHMMNNHAAAQASLRNLTLRSSSSAATPHSKPRSVRTRPLAAHAVCRPCDARS